jgi:hypothetical protein
MPLALFAHLACAFPSPPLVSLLERESHLVARTGQTCPAPRPPWTNARAPPLTLEKKNGVSFSSVRTRAHRAVRTQRARAPRSRSTAGAVFTPPPQHPHLYEAASRRRRGGCMPLLCPLPPLHKAHTHASSVHTYWAHPFFAPAFFLSLTHTLPPHRPLGADELVVHPTTTHSRRTHTPPQKQARRVDDDDDDGGALAQHGANVPWPLQQDAHTFFLPKKGERAVVGPRSPFCLLFRRRAPSRRALAAGARAALPRCSSRTRSVFFLARPLTDEARWRPFTQQQHLARRAGQNTTLPSTSPQQRDASSFWLLTCAYIHTYCSVYFCVPPSTHRAPHHSRRRRRRLRPHRRVFFAAVLLSPLAAAGLRFSARVRARVHDLHPPDDGISRLKRCVGLCRAHVQRAAPPPPSLCRGGGGGCAAARAPLRHKWTTTHYTTTAKEAPDGFVHTACSHRAAHEGSARPPSCEGRCCAFPLAPPSFAPTKTVEERLDTHTARALGALLPRACFWAPAAAAATA